MATKVINFPVPAVTPPVVQPPPVTPPALPVTIVDNTANGVDLAQNGDTLTITDSTPPPPSTITSVTVTGPATLAENATAQFAAHVSGTGDFNPAVVWSCSDGTISQGGLFTAPAKIENVVVAATSVQDPTKVGPCPVAISTPTNTVKIPPSGGDDTAALQAAWDAAASAGKILEMTLGTWHLNPVNKPLNGILLIDPGVLITDESAYGTNAVMFNVANGGGSITGTGAFAQMPLSFAQSVKDGSEFRHCIAIGQSGAVSNFTLIGLSISEAGGDGVYIRNCSGVTISNVTTKGVYRNGMSITGVVNGLTMNSCACNAGLRAGIDLEPNLTTDYLQNVVLNNCSTSGNPGGGISFGIYALDKTSQPVSITANGFTSTNDGGYGIFFTNNNFGDTPAGSITVNSAVVTGCAFGGAYGRYTGSGPEITFNNLQIINSNQKGMDPHYGMNSACGVDLTGGVTGPCGAANFNIKLISNNTGKMVNYFQQGNQGGNAVNTTFQVVPGGSISGATNPNPVTKYP